MGTSIKVVGTGSSENGYILQSDNQCLIIELGCKFSDYVEQLKDNFGNVGGVIASHRRHHDHINPSTAKEFIRRGVDCYAHEEVIKEGHLSDFKPLFSGHRNEVGQFIVQTFKAPHNVPNYGFLITTPTKERILFLTDTTGVNLKFKDIDCIMIECNHDDKTLLDNLDRQEVSMAHPEFHLGLEDCAKFCKANLSASTKEIILIHLSSMNINPDYAVKVVRDYTGCPCVSVAHAGHSYKIDNDEF